jgi:methylase of polypeptide subunit release factors
MPQNKNQTINISKFPELSKSIHDLWNESNKRKAIDIGIRVANNVMKIFMPTNTEWQSQLAEGEEALDKVIPAKKLPNQKSETWFLPHPYLGGERIILEQFCQKDATFECRFYALNKSSAKARVSAGVHLTKNWEHSELTKNVAYKVGINFFLSGDLKRVLIVLSNRGNLRVMELGEHLTNTQIEIFNKLYGVCELKGASVIDDATQNLIHTTLWDNFALHKLNNKFYAGIASHFELLLQHLTEKSGGAKNTEDEKLFVSRLLGRLLFVWFLRKKRIVSETNGYFDTVNDLNASDYYAKYLKKLFFEILNTPIKDRKSKDNETPYLNGGLFEYHKNDWMDEKVSFPPDWFQTLYRHFNEFNFTTDESSPEYEQVAIDPEMLGRVFERLLATQITTTGKQDRKEKGAFYTPREIVAYMCKESLRQYLYTGLNNSSLNAGVDNLLDKNDADFETAHTNARRDLWGLENSDKVSHDVISLLDKIKILDPACGSGAFPMGMVQLLEKVYERLEPRFDRHKIKLAVIQNNIYGVDIEPMAVEIARLRAWLSIVVDEEDIHHIKPLPNLDFKFVCANSLITLEKTETEKGNFEFDDTTVFDELYHFMQRYTIIHDPKGKEEALQEYQAIRKRIVQKNKQNITSVRNKQIATWDPKQETPASFFDPETMFAVKGGFDVVIGNPPYVSTKGVTADDKKLLEKEYGFSDDTYNHFFIKGMELIVKNGILTYITPKTFWTIQTKYNLRKLLLSKQIVYIFDTANPFASAMVDTCITCVKNCTSKMNKIKFLDGSQDLLEPKCYAITQQTYIDAQNLVIFKPTDENMKTYANFFLKCEFFLEKFRKNFIRSPIV